MPNNSSKIISLMFIIGRRMREEMKQNEKIGGCSWIHFEALRYIDEKGKPLMSDVAAYFSITRPAATLLVDGLVEGKMLRRIVDPKDRRSVRVALTTKGKNILAHGIKQRVKKIQEVFSVLDTKEHAELVRILNKIAKSK
jgi:DNA-binding MarR family transcriptional regulator